MITRVISRIVCAGMGRSAGPCGSCGWRALIRGSRFRTLIIVSPCIVVICLRAVLACFIMRVGNITFFPLLLV